MLPDACDAAVLADEPGDPSSVSRNSISKNKKLEKTTPSLAEAK
jgi:hypothetical protein